MRLTEARLAFAYFLLGSLWIVATDWLLSEATGGAMRAAQTAKGLLFVAAGALLLYVFAARWAREREVSSEDRARLERRLAALSRFEAIGQLTGGIAHDFNNLITAIAGNLTTWASRTAQPELPEELREVARAADRATELTRQLLTFGRGEGGGSERVEVNAVVEGLSSLLSRLIGDRIRIVTELGEDLRVAVDPGRLEQVVMNLALNARDAMPTGGELRIRTTAERVDDAAARRFPFPFRPGDYVRLDVADTGAGMPLEVRSRIFEPFFTTKPNGSGTGLGLATVYAIVKQGGGYITVDSTPGRGSTFRVYFPQATTPRPLPPPPPAPREPEDDTPGAGTVLVAEDDPAVRSLMVRILERRGFSVVDARDGREALDVIRNGEGVDLLVTDAVMPGMTGPQLIAAARRVSPGLRVLMVSGYGEADLGAGVPHLPKPFTPVQLARGVREALEI